MGSPTLDEDAARRRTQDARDAAAGEREREQDLRDDSAQRREELADIRDRDLELREHAVSAARARSASTAREQAESSAELVRDSRLAVTRSHDSLDRVTALLDRGGRAYERAVARASLEQAEVDRLVREQPAP